MIGDMTTEQAVAWWLAESERGDVRLDDVCEVRGDVVLALLDAYRERENARAK